MDLKSQRMARIVVEMLLAISNDNLDFVGAVEMEMRIYREELSRARKAPLPLSQSRERA
ncbi:MAG TPA: hypothetical protein VF188_16265 [Longimicrobiales bacterium]